MVDSEVGFGMIRSVAFTWRLIMEREVRTFRDKVGIVMTTLGVATIFLGILVFASWLFMPLASRSQINIVKFLVVLGFIAISLIRLSFYTVKKDRPSSS